MRRLTFLRKFIGYRRKFTGYHREKLDGGLQPCLVDISPQTLAFDLDQLTILRGERTLAVICVHPFGLPQDISPVRRLAQSVGGL